METIIATMKETRLNISDSNEIQDWCTKLKCTNEELMYGISKVGTRFTCLESYIEMNKNLIAALLKSKSFTIHKKHG